MNCEYGCGQKATRITKGGRHICGTVQSCPVNKAKYSKGLKAAYASGRKVVAWTDEHRAKSRQTQLDRSIKRSFRKGSTVPNSHLRYLMFEHLDVPKECQWCKLTEWLSQPIKLELDHIDGDNTNNEIDNLRMLCPNCHSMTPTWRGLNINTGFQKVSDDDLIDALNTCPNIRQALLKVGLTPKGANYARAKKLRGSGETG